MWEQKHKFKCLSLKGEETIIAQTHIFTQAVFITIFKECLCWLIKSTDCCHYSPTEQQTHTPALLPAAASSNTSAWEYLFFVVVFFPLHSPLQNVIDFVSFAVPWLHCRQYCLIRLPDYSSREWKENGMENNDNAEIFSKCRRKEMYEKYITLQLNSSVQRHQQTKK